jgi:hypothetical protein
MYLNQIEVYGIKRGNYGEVGEDAMSALNGEREQFEDYLKDEIATVSDASSDADVKLVTEKWGVMHDLMNSAGTCPPPTGKEEQWALTNGAIFCLTVLTTIGGCPLERLIGHPWAQRSPSAMLVYLHLAPCTVMQDTAM